MMHFSMLSFSVFQVDGNQQKKQDDIFPMELKIFIYYPIELKILIYFNILPDRIEDFIQERYIVKQN